MELILLRRSTDFSCLASSLYLSTVCLVPDQTEFQMQSLQLLDQAFYPHFSRLAVQIGLFFQETLHLSAFYSLPQTHRSVDYKIYPLMCVHVILSYLLKLYDLIFPNPLIIRITTPFYQPIVSSFFNNLFNFPQSVFGMLGCKVNFL